MCKEIEKKNNMGVVCGKSLFDDLCIFEDIDPNHLHRCLTGKYVKRDRETIYYYINEMLKQIDFYKMVLEGSQKRLKANILKEDNGYLNKDIQKKLEVM